MSELTWFYVSCQIKVAHISQRGCDRFSAVLGDRGELEVSGTADDLFYL